MLLANGTFPTNADGIAVGGIRTPWISAPVVALTGVGGGPYGRTTPLDAARSAVRYPEGRQF
jgi:hypothetical protein